MFLKISGLTPLEFRFFAALSEYGANFKPAATAAALPQQQQLANMPIEMLVVEKVK